MNGSSSSINKNFLSGISLANSHPNFTNKQITINDFSVGKLLGKGGFGNVYAAHYRPSPDRNMKVALKIVLLSLFRTFERYK
jgi:serine/threonine protein kinase